MADIEHLELAAHHGTIIADINHLVEKYRAIFDFDMPDMDQHLADRLILDEMSEAVAEIKSYLISR